MATAYDFAGKVVGDLRWEDVHVETQQSRVQVEMFRVRVEGVLQAHRVQVQMVVGILVAQPTVFCLNEHNPHQRFHTRSNLETSNATDGEIDTSVARKAGDESSRDHNAVSQISEVVNIVLLNLSRETETKTKTEKKKRKKKRNRNQRNKKKNPITTDSTKSFQCGHSHYSHPRTPENYYLRNSQ